MPKRSKKTKKKHASPDDNVYLPADELIRLLMARTMALEALLLSKGIFNTEELDFVVDEVSGSVSEMFEGADDYYDEEPAPKHASTNIKKENLN